MAEKALKDLDKNHPFYSDEANALRRRRIKELIQEEEQLALENRKHYRNRNKRKKGEKPIDGDEEVSEGVV